MFDTISLSNIFVAVLIVGIVLFIFLLYVAFRLEALSKYFERQRVISELKKDIISEIKKDTAK